ncbi:serine protease inhibitor swm-1-like [Haemaphysalis longicornis]
MRAHKDSSMFCWNRKLLLGILFGGFVVCVQGSARSLRSLTRRSSDGKLEALRVAIQSSISGSPSTVGNGSQFSVIRSGSANGLKIVRKAGSRRPTCRGANEAYADCGADCELVCNRPMPKSGCYRTCTPGCICKHGYIRSSAQGPCVPVSTCQPDCGPNRRFELCASLCPAVCDVRPKRCARLCRMNACVCAQGFILDRNGTDCVPRDKCRRF